MDKPRRDLKNSLTAKIYRPIKEPNTRPRVWCGDEAVEEHFSKPKPSKANKIDSSFKGPPSEPDQGGSC